MAEFKTIKTEENNSILTEIIYNTYDIIGILTPIKDGDCGKLCGKICCEGDGAGMLLFPGEEYIFGGIPGFSIHDIDYMETPGVKLLFCDGECERVLRPLACRIFPVAPVVDKDGSVTVRPDIRGRRMCPIWELKNVDKAFIKAVGKVFALLSKNEVMLSFMRLISAEQDKLRRIYKK